MTDDVFTDIARQWHEVRTHVEDLHQQVRQLADSHYQVADAAGTVEVTLNGDGRLIGLRLDERLLSLDATDVARRINEVLWAAQQLVEDTYAEAEPDLVAQAQEFITRFHADEGTHR